MRAGHALAAAAVFSLLGGLAPAQAGDPSGLWLTKDRDAKIRVGSCGGGMCGTIVWLAQPIDPATGRPQTDKANPDPSRRNRPLVGVSILLGMRPTGGDKWSGHIYNADDGKTYDGSITLVSPGTLRIEGCLGIFCQSENWTRTN
jgi:uncharacterized protein (DUF2147 family)